MPMTKTTLTEQIAQPLSTKRLAELAALAARPDSDIDFSDQAEITPEKIAAGDYKVVRRGGARRGAGRKPTGKLTKQVRLSAATIRKLRSFQKRKGLASFSDAVTAAAELV